jgi:hypothetical protein
MATLLSWFVAAFDKPFNYIGIEEAATAEDFMSSHPGAYAIQGPFVTEADGELWLKQNKNWPPPPAPKSPSGGGGKKPAGGGNPSPAPPGGGGSGGGDPGGKFWVTWKDESDDTAARNSAIIWGPQADPPAQRAGWFLAGAFATRADARAYKNAIGKGTLKPPPGTPVFGGQKIPDPLSGIDAVGSFFNKLGDRATWIRVAKVVIGAIMIIAGLVRMGVPGAEKIASKLPPVVPV